jgi:hypothetical protein
MMIGPTKKFSRFFSVECLDMHQKSEGDHGAATRSPSPLFVQQRKVQAEDIPRSLFSFNPHDPDRGGAQEEVKWKELEEASATLEEAMNNRKQVCAVNKCVLHVHGH